MGSPYGVRACDISAAAVDTVPEPIAPHLIDGSLAAPELVALCRDCEKVGLWSSSQWITQIKADGVRAFYVDGVVYGREGGPLDCARHAAPGLRRLEQAYGQPMMFDAEYVEEGGYLDTLSALKRGRGDGVVWIFDAVPLVEWQRNQFSQLIEDRLALLNKHIGAAASPWVGLMAHGVHDASGVLVRAQRAWADDLEGVVAKRPGSLYQRKRTNDWLRLTETREGLFPIVDMMAKDNRLAGVMVRTPWGQVTLRSGWEADEGGVFYRAALSTPEDAPQWLAEMSYKLSAGTRRTVRSAKFLGFRHGGRA